MFTKYLFNHRSDPFGVCALLNDKLPLYISFFRYVLWIVLPVLLIVSRFFEDAAFAATNIFIANSVDVDLIGSANGFGATCASAGR